MSTFSRQSRNRLLQFLKAIDWQTVAPRGFLWITLTYPGGHDSVPRDGRTTKRHLRAWRMRWERRWGKPIGVWKLEFQQRGAPHFHLLIALPEMTNDLANAWWTVVGSQDRNHLKIGATANMWHDAEVPVGYLTGLSNTDPERKAYQHQVPDEFECVGKWWDAWNLKPDWQEVEVAEQEWFQVRRTGRKAYKAARGKPMRCRTAPYAGLWVALEGSAVAWANRALGRQVFSEPPDPDGDPQASLPDPPWVPSGASAIDVEDISE